MTGRSGTALALVVLLAPVGAAAEPATACGHSDRLLMYCTFDNGARQVGLCLSDDTLTYAYGPDQASPELRMTRSRADVDYTPYGWASNTIFESVTLYNGDTAYDVFSARPRGENAGIAEGGITVTIPGQGPVTLTCDEGTVRPNDPWDGIGQLSALDAANGQQRLSACLDTASEPQACLGLVQRADIEQNGCVVGQDPTDCWAKEAEAWDIVMQNAVKTSLARVAAMRGAQYAQRLQASQSSWEQTRNLDCGLTLMLPFAGDGGMAKCLAHYSASRLDLLQDMVAMAEFDG